MSLGNSSEQIPPSALLTKSQSEDLSPSSELALIALSNKSLVRRYWDYIVWQQRELVRNELSHSIVAAFIVGVFVVLIEGFSFSSFLWALLAFVALFVGKVIISASRAPVQIDNALRRSIATQAEIHRRDQAELENSKPKIEGEIQWFISMPYRDWVRSADEPIADLKEVGVIATLRVFFVNKTHAPTTIKHFMLRIKHMEANRVYKACYPIEDHILRGGWDTDKADEDQDYVYNLVDFSKTREVMELGHHVEGYLQFKVPDLLLAKETENEGRTTMKPMLTITDAWGQEHELLYRKGIPLLPSQFVWGHTKPQVIT